MSFRYWFRKFLDLLPPNKKGVVAIKNLVTREQTEMKMTELIEFLKK